jgi:hypothetical protein
MLTSGITSKYYLNFYICIIIQLKPFISIGHNDDTWQIIEALKNFHMCKYIIITICQYNYMHDILF